MKQLRCVSTGERGSILEFKLRLRDTSVNGLPSVRCIEMTCLTIQDRVGDILSSFGGTVGSRSRSSVVGLRHGGVLQAGAHFDDV